MSLVELEKCRWGSCQNPEHCGHWVGELLVAGVSVNENRRWVKVSWEAAWAHVSSWNAQHLGLPCVESWRQIREGDENAEIIYMERWILLQNLSRTMNCWLDKGIATHSTVLAWRIPWTEESGRLQSIALHRVRRDWSDLACIHSWTAGSIPKVFSKLPQGNCSSRMLSPDLHHWMVLLPAS